MQLIAVGTPDTVVQRLARQGWQGCRIGGLVPAQWAGLPDIASAQALRGPRTWIVGSASPHTVQLNIEQDDVLIDLTSGLTGMSNRVTVSLQDSPFAIDYGFLLTAGGAPDKVQKAVTVLDALAPAPKAWLYAGGHAAPAFLATLMQEFGMNWMAIAAAVTSQNLAAGLSPWWDQQRSLLARLARPAATYLATEQDAEYRALHGTVNPFPYPAPGGKVEDSPARKVAQLLCWLHQQSHASPVSSAR